MGKRKFKYIYRGKVPTDIVGKRFNTVKSENYASLIDLDVSYELKMYLDIINKRFNNHQGLEHRPEFSVPLIHLIEITKELSLMLNSYTENPPDPNAEKFDYAFLIFIDTVKMLNILQDYLDDKLKDAKKVMLASRNLENWEDAESFSSALRADLSCKGDLRFKKTTNVQQWEDAKKRNKNAKRRKSDN